jgi:transposase
MPPSKVTPEIRAAAMADLAAGEQPAIVAQRYGLDRDVVNKWKQRMTAQMSASMSAPVSTDTPIRRPTIEAQQRLVIELVYQNLLAKLTASERLATHITSNDEWLNRQSAEGVATLGQWLDSTAAATLALLATTSGEGDA